MIEGVEGGGTFAGAVEEGGTDGNGGIGSNGGASMAWITAGEGEDAAVSEGGGEGRAPARVGRAERQRFREDEERGAPGEEVAAERGSAWLRRGGVISSGGGEGGGEGKSKDTRIFH